MIAFIPARGGSKGLPGKNIKMLNGKPLIAYTIEAALQAESIDRVIVTTDDEQIARTAKEYGAEVPFLRPAELSSDTASAVDVYLHAAEFVSKETGEQVEKFMVLLPTAPLRGSGDIDAAVEFFKEKQACTLLSVKEAETPLSWYYKEDENGYMENAGIDVANAVANRQVNKPYVIPNGAIYILDYELLKTKRTYYCEKTVAFPMSKEKSVDIDDALDFKFAEFLMQKEE